VRHTKWLKKEEAAYRAMGWRVTFLTETAASNEDNVGIPFFSDHNRDNPEAGASLVKWREGETPNQPLHAWPHASRSFGGCGETSSYESIALVYSLLRMNATEHASPVRCL
jgi:hypothetical protein